MKINRIVSHLLEKKLPEIETELEIILSKMKTKSLFIFIKFDSLCLKPNKILEIMTYFNSDIFRLKIVSEKR
jgi:hypothetical protein